MATPAAKPAYRSLTYFSIGLPNGTHLLMKPGDYVPPSFGRVNAHQTAQWLSDGTVVLVADADPAALKAAEAAAAGSTP